MNHIHPGQRFRIVAVLSIAIFMAFSSYWLSLVIQKNGASEGRKTTRNTPDYHVENFNFVKMSTKGLPRYHINGTKLLHFPQKGTLEIEKPVVKSLDEKAPEQTLRSNSAILANGNSKLHLYGHAQYSRAATSDSSALNLVSEYLLILLNKDIIKTDKPVTIYHGNSTMKGVGMVASTVTRELRVLDQVKIKLAPPDQE